MSFKNCFLVLASVMFISSTSLATPSLNKFCIAIYQPVECLVGDKVVEFTNLCHARNALGDSAAAVCEVVETNADGAEAGDLPQ